MGSAEEPVVHCWGCSKLVLVPYLDDMPAEMFKCGWCGAVNDLKQQPLAAHAPEAHNSLGLSSWRPSQHHQPQYHLDSHNRWQKQPQHGQQSYDYYSQQQHEWQQQQQWQSAIWQPGQVTADAGSSAKQHRCSRSTCWAVLMRLWRWVVVALVLVLVGSITGCGVFTLLPLICTTWATYLPNMGFTLLLLFQIMWNYAAAVLRPAGRVSDFVSPPVRTPGGSVLQGGLQHWSWCRHCQAAKPPQAHHCNSCGTCVYAMDHHCPFIANCVGQGNLRAFLLVLLWALVAAGYILCMCSLLVWQHWDIVKASVGAGRSSQPSAQHPNLQAQHVWGVNSPHAGSAANSSSSTAASAAAAAAGGSSGSLAVQSAAAPDLWLFATTGIFMLVLQASPWWLLAAYYLVAVSIGILLAVGALLGSQLYYLGLGVSYIDHLKASQGAGGQHQNGSLQDQQVLQHDVAQGRYSRWVGRIHVTWVRWWEVMGVGPASAPGPGSMLWAIVKPRWSLPTAEGTKKWS